MKMHLPRMLRTIGSYCYEAVYAAGKSEEAARGCNAALCTARSYGQLASLNAPEAVIALVDRKEAVPLNWT